MKELTLQCRPIIVRLRDGHLFMRILGRHIWREIRIEELEPEVISEIQEKEFI